MAKEFQLFTSLRFDPKLLNVCSSGLEHAGWQHQNASPLYMLDFHRDRILRAARYWHWEKAIDSLSGDSGLERLGNFILDFVGREQTKPHRVKVVVFENGAMSAEMSAVPELPLTNFFPGTLPEPGKAPEGNESEYLPFKDSEYAVVVDGHRTAKSEYTHFKTTNRDMYDTARQRAVISGAVKKEVLLVNESCGSVMEGSLTTPYLWRNGRWVTPPVSPQFSLGDSGGQDGTTRRWALERGMVVEGDIKAETLVDGEECWISNGVRGFIFGRIKLV